MRKKDQPDYFLLGTIGALMVFGILILTGVSAPISMEKFGSTFYYLKHQLIFGLIPGIFLAFIAFKVKISFLRKWAPLLLLVNIILMVLVFFPKIGSGTQGASRWLNLGPLSFQPSEFLKISFFLYLASWLSSKDFLRIKKSSYSKGNLLGFAAFLVIIGMVSLLLILQPDISTLVVIVLVAGVMYFLAETPLWHTAVVTLGGLGGLLALIKIAPYRMARFLVFLKPETDPMGMGYHLKQSLIAIGSGGFWGLGLGLSHQKFGFLPGTIADSIFAIFAEEAGFIGSIILISLFLLFFWRGFKISKRTSNDFYRFLGLGLTFWLVFQAFVNIGAMIGILPLTGIPLPFISYGGSAMVAELIGVGILLNISKNVR